MQPARIADFLRRLPESQFVLHGSVHHCDILKPHQASGYSDEKHQNLNALYATTIIEIALLKATAVAKPGEWGWRFNFGWFSWRRNPLLEVYGDVSVGSGYIYILDLSEFEMLTHFTYVAYKPVQPLMVVEVSPAMYVHFKNIRFKGHFLG